MFNTSGRSKNRGGEMKKIVGLILLLCLMSMLSVLVDVSAETGVREVRPKKVQKDTTGDGKVDRVEYYDETGSILKIEADSSGDGQLDEWVYYDNGVLIRAEKDTTGDGNPDTWIDY
jgi:hypothetical protein